MTWRGNVYLTELGAGIGSTWIEGGSVSVPFARAISRADARRLFAEGREVEARNQGDRLRRSCRRLSRIGSGPATWWCAVGPDSCRRASCHCNAAGRP
jgi:hypothetical protein